MVKRIDQFEVSRISRRKIAEHDTDCRRKDECRQVDLCVEDERHLQYERQRQPDNAAKAGKRHHLNQEL